MLQTRCKAGVSVLTTSTTQQVSLWSVGKTGKADDAQWKD